MSEDAPVTEPRTEAERVVIHECGGSCDLAMYLILLMRAAEMSMMRATAIARSCRFARSDAPDYFLGSTYRWDLNAMLSHEPPVHNLIDHTIREVDDE